MNASNLFDFRITTSVPMKKYTFKWSFLNYSAISSFRSVKSLDFYPLSKNPWCILLMKRQIPKMSLIIINKFDRDIVVECKTYVVDRGGQHLLRKTSRRTFDETGSENFTILENEEVPSGEDEITFLGELKLIKPADFITRFSDDCELQPERQLSDYLKYQFENSEFTSDIILFVGDNKIHAHKAILSARSPKLSKMIQNQKESGDDCLNITGIEIDICKILIAFLYYGTVDENIVNLDVACSLYKSAIEYEIPELRETCVGIMMGKLDADNACRVLAFADHHAEDSWKMLMEEYKHLVVEIIQECNEDETLHKFYTK